MSSTPIGAEQTHDALLFTPVHLVALHGPESVPACLRVARAALLPLHPDLLVADDQLPASTFDARVSDAIRTINDLVTTADSNPNLEVALYEAAANASSPNAKRILLHNNIANQATNATRSTLQSDSFAEPRSEGIHMPEATGEILKPGLEPLGLLFGSRVLSIVANLSSDTFQESVRRFRREVPRIDTAPAGMPLGFWNELFDHLASDDLDMDRLRMLEKSDDIPDKVLRDSLARETTRLSVFFDKVHPTSQNTYPANWFRSFSGKVIAPCHEEEWTGADNFENRHAIPEIGTIQIFEVTDGIIQTVTEINPKSRKSVTPLTGTQDSDWINTLKAHVAEITNHNPEEFVENLNGEQYPMDFIFSVGNDGRTRIIQTRKGTQDMIKQHSKMDGVDTEPETEKTLELLAPLTEGYYMIKAGKKKGALDYDSPNPPLALIELDPQINPDRRQIGASLVLGFSADVDDINGSAQEFEEVRRGGTRWYRSTAATPMSRFLELHEYDRARLGNQPLLPFETPPSDTFSVRQMVIHGPSGVSIQGGISFRSIQFQREEVIQ